MEKPQPLLIGLTVISLALLLASLFARYWALEQATEFTGPTHIAAGSDQVYLYAAGDIYQLSHEGELLSVSPSQRTGLTDDPIDLRVVHDGRLLIAEQRPARIRLCNVESWICAAMGERAERLVERQFKVLVSASASELLLTDARGDTLWRLPESGGDPQKLLPEQTLAGPNDIAYGPGGNLWIADTDNRRIVELTGTENGSYEQGREQSMLNDLTVGERYYPMMLVPAMDSRWWVIQAAEFSKPHADVLIYDPDEGAQALIDLPMGAYATDLVALDDAVLVTDYLRYAVYHVDADTLQVSAFGDPDFARLMGQIRERRDHFELLGSGALIAVILCAALMIIAAFLASPREKRWTQVPPLFDLENAPAQTPRVSGIHWLEVNPAIKRSLKWLDRLGFILFAAVCVCTFIFYAWYRVQVGVMADEELEVKFRELGLMALLGGLLLVLIVPIIRFSTQAMKRKLGTDGKSLYIRLVEGRELLVDPSRLAYTDRLILYRQYTMPLQGGKQQPFYAPGEVETWLAPLLRHAKKLTAVQAMKHQWKHQPGRIFWSFIVISVAAVLLAAMLFI